MLYLKRKSHHQTKQSQLLIALVQEKTYFSFKDTNTLVTEIALLMLVNLLLIWQDTPRTSIFECLYYIGNYDIRPKKD